MSFLEALKEEFTPWAIARDAIKAVAFCFAIALLVFFLITLMMYPWQVLLTFVLGIFGVSLIRDLF